MDGKGKTGEKGKRRGETWKLGKRKETKGVRREEDKERRYK